MESEGHKDRSHWVWIILGLLVVAVVAGVVGARPTWRYIKKVRAEGFLERYEARRATNDLTGALSDLRAAFLLAPSHVPIRQAAARHYSDIGAPDALNLWRQLSLEGPLSEEDQIRYARTTVGLNRVDLANPLVNGLLKTRPNDPEVLTLASQLAQVIGDMPRAIAFADRAHTESPTNLVYLQRLAALELSAGDPSRKQSGKQRLMALAAGERADRVRAASLLLSQNVLTSADAGLLLRLIPATESAPLEERLLRLQLENVRDPAGRAERARTLAEPIWAQSKLDELVLAGLWLGAIRAYEDLAVLIPEDHAVRDERLLRLRAGALAELERWPELDSLLARPGAPQAPLAKSVLLATSTHAAGRTNESLAHWQQALTLAQDDLGMLEAIARLSENRGYPAVAIVAWRKLLSDPRQAPRAGSELLRIASAERDLSSARDALIRLEQLGLMPAHQKPVLAFADLLLNNDPRRARLLGEGPLPDKADTNLVAVTAALLALREDKPEDAAEALEGLQIDWMTAPIPWRAVRLAQLGATGQRTEVRALVPSFSKVNLLPAERALIEPWAVIPK